MKNKFILFIALVFAIVACDPSDFEDTNVDPRRVTEAPTRTLLTFSLQQLPFTVWNTPIRNVAGYSTVHLNFYSQYLSEGPYPAASLYNVRNLSWTSWYTGPLYNLQTIINLNKEDNKLADQAGNGSKNNQVAVARILKAYYFWFLTDNYGDIPYFDALKGNEVLQPKYDKQQDIYNDLFKELTEAVAMINEGEAGVTGDILMNGDMAAWKRFANTARLFMALRIMKVNPAKAQTEMAAALNAGVIESNAQNVTFDFIGSDPHNWNPWYENYSNDNRNDYAISERLGNYMIDTKDPRVFVYGEVLNGEVKPLPYGSSAAKNIPGIYSRIGSALQDAGASAPIFTYAQVLFAKAEALNRGFSVPGSGTAATLYTDGIKASWQFWGVYNEAKFNEFIAQPEIAYTATNGLQKIITQKWVHQYQNGFEAWTDWRRTGYPVLTAAPDAVDARGIPRRMGYPSNARALNQAGYDEVVKRQGADHNYTRMWWDVQ
ncbi:SusD/RagB family nutrient-binding outer membrane lipoprotein [Pontibacter cellulosilyticus]|uniref:SusD/RagB family nutrient-binding outer membrane lipoprotein n=1 Tax=Pontibacter cellulosilyticus TaxID=1720253 RepID=A0A923N8D1_9BACT|nr:SusD/RagB family nutrient-binding outer membrane lipoprotein [Pontibacter cellulosilyticus]MBC5994785.1 SusD/RagB family nutrient-binding outer membrane lipoprotein [Pontibacter cellulosilyticus]